MTNDLTAKRLEILREIVPKLRRMVTFYDPRTPGAVTSLAAAREAAGKLDLEVVAQQVSSSEELRDRLRSLSTVDADAYFFVADFLVIGHAPLVIAAAHTLRLPTMATEVSIVRAGALAAYGPDFREYGRRPARYVARILEGSLPRDFPVEVINRPALAINLKTARAIGLDIPPLLLTRADRGNRMRRRDAIVLIGSAALSGTINHAAAQQSGRSADVQKGTRWHVMPSEVRGAGLQRVRLRTRQARLGRRPEPRD